MFGVSTLCVGCSTGGAVWAGRLIPLNVSSTPLFQTQKFIYSNGTRASTKAQADIECRSSEVDAGVSSERSEVCDPSRSTLQDFELSSESQKRKPESALSPTTTAGAMKKCAPHSRVPEFATRDGVEGDPTVDGPPLGNSRPLKRTYALSEHCATPAFWSCELT